ncbi:MAG: 16S rRNA (guanine(527)-N(7))-methyltransferase RsmG [Alphaproteobacteria bacterium 43-37]|nr:MAG: 16S rRNA (guanine(527)-N(7))-methyltransferase RsmG [Alphaproteobacteria bacterium 43-37]
MSIEKTQKFEMFGNLLKKWNGSIALTSRAKRDFWGYHQESIDEAQLLSRLLDKQRPVLDIGSGNGYPGIPLAIDGHAITMVEIKQKKASFLKFVASSLELETEILAENIQQVNRPFLQIVSKAFASVVKTLDLTHSVRHEETTFFLLKGEKFHEELQEAETQYTFSFKVHPIESNNKVVLELWNVKDVR